MNLMLSVCLRTRYRGLFLVFVALSALWPSREARAERVLRVPPISFGSVSGGVLRTDPADPTSVRTCISADMEKGSNYPAEQGVGYVSQGVTITLQNIASIAAPVKVTFMAGTKIESRNTNGAANIWPSFTGPSQELTAAKTVRINLGPEETGSVTIHYNCRKSECQVSFSCAMISRATVSGDCDLSQAADLNGPDWGGVCGSDTQVCISQSSKTLLQIRALTDRGALLGRVSTGAHRCAGWKDHYTGALPGFELNGGRPF